MFVNFCFKKLLPVCHHNSGAFHCGLSVWWISPKKESRCFPFLGGGGGGGGVLNGILIENHK
jgi:hypothetical protein